MAKIKSNPQSIEDMKGEDDLDWDYRDYRVIKSFPYGPNAAVYQIHVVYYLDDKIVYWTKDGVRPRAYEIEELRTIVFGFRMAFEMPVLELKTVNGKDVLVEVGTQA